MEVEIHNVMMMPRCICGKCLPGKVPCVYCAKGISSTLAYCPSCGHPQKISFVGQDKETDDNEPRRVRR